MLRRRQSFACASRSRYRLPPALPALRLGDNLQEWTQRQMEFENGLEEMERRNKELEETLAAERNRATRAHSMARKQKAGPGDGTSIGRRERQGRCADSSHRKGIRRRD
jgi:hypothetical protein